MFHSKTALALAAAWALAGCASVDIDSALREANDAAPAFTQGRLELARTPSQREARARLVDALLAAPVGSDAAVQLALANSPQFQAIVAQGWADMAEANQGGRIANPLLSLERMRLGNELEIGRLLSFGLLDLLTLPQRQGIARNRESQSRLQMASRVVEQVGVVRQAWIRAVAAQQVLAYAGQVHEAADASAELARRMERAGNFNKLQRARQQLFYADATARLASARHDATSTREQLVRALGLDDAQASRLVLPPRLPDLPKQPLAAPDITSAALQQRLDWRVARLQLQAAAQAQGIDVMASLIDIEAGVRHDTVFDNASGQRTSRNGIELGIRLPLFDAGDARRAGMNARTLAAASRFNSVAGQATSQLRESYSAYRTAFDIATHYRDEIVPLRQTMSEENVLRRASWNPSTRNNASGLPTLHSPQQ